MSLLQGIQLDILSAALPLWPSLASGPRCHEGTSVGKAGRQHPAKLTGPGAGALGKRLACEVPEDGVAVANQQAYLMRIYCVSIAQFCTARLLLLICSNEMFATATRKRNADVKCHSDRRFLQLDCVLSLLHYRAQYTVTHAFFSLSVYCLLCITVHSIQ